MVMAGRPLGSMTDTDSSTKTVADSPSLKRTPPDAVTSGMFMVTNLRGREDHRNVRRSPTTIAFGTHPAEQSSPSLRMEAGSRAGRKLEDRRGALPVGYVAREAHWDGRPTGLRDEGGELS